MAEENKRAVDLGGVQREAAGEGPEVTFNGKTFRLVPTLPIEFLEELGAMAEEHAAGQADRASGDADGQGLHGARAGRHLLNAAKLMLGPSWAAFEAEGPGIDVLVRLMAALEELYPGMDPGEARSSAG
jgi:hypothetical protein